MLLATKVLAGLVLFIHIYIFLLETVLFNTRGRKVFGFTQEQALTLKPLMSNQGCYNGFLAAAMALGLLLPDASTARAFLIYGFACVAVAGVWGAVTAQIRILFIQTLPAVLGLAALLLA